MVRQLRLIGVICGLLLGSILVHAQSDDTQVSDAACAPALETIWTAASEACIGRPQGFVCNGGAVPVVAPEGPVSNALAPTGALVEVQVIEAIQTPALTVENSSGGVAWLRLPAPLTITGLMVGNVRAQNVSLPNFPPWQSIIVQTANETPVCGIAPQNALILQTILGQPVNIVVNGASLIFDGTVIVQTRPDETLFVAISGRSRIVALGQEQTLFTGQQISVPYAPEDFSTPAGGPSVAAPLDMTRIQHLPVALLDRPLSLPQPGYVATAGQVNMRAEPTVNGMLLGQIPANQIMSILGRNPTGDWFHVRLDTGETGWVFAELVLQYTGSIEAVYEATPIPPQRYGISGLTATVLPAAGVNLRTAPEVTFPAIATLRTGTELILVARSPYSPWVKVQVGDLEGWVALITLETDAVLEALPIDYDVPPPPPPTRIPGSFGNAFPDPTLNDP